MQLLETKIFTKLDIRGAYNLIRTRAGEESTIAIRTRYGLLNRFLCPEDLPMPPLPFKRIVTIRYAYL